jgi:phosphatidylglycerophosphate synthase
MKHLLLVMAVLLYVLVWAQNWTWFAGAIMLRAILVDRRRSVATAACPAARGAG